MIFGSHCLNTKCIHTMISAPNSGCFLQTCCVNLSWSYLDSFIQSTLLSIPKWQWNCKLQLKEVFYDNYCCNEDNCTPILTLVRRRWCCSLSIGRKAMLCEDVLRDSICCLYCWALVWDVWKSSEVSKVYLVWKYQATVSINLPSVKFFEVCVIDIED